MQYVTEINRSHLNIMNLDLDRFIHFLISNGKTEILRLQKTLVWNAQTLYSEHVTFSQNMDSNNLIV